MIIIEIMMMIRDVHRMHKGTMCCGVRGFVAVHVMVYKIINDQM